ncbi:MAG: hypothetical protein D6707_06725 [Bacteroidetes bacterium]|nr:MAG: hypothetical protein D6707_06725 [Bacteroidota bacterium]
MPKVKKIGIFSLAKLHTIVGAIVGLILGIIYSFGGLLLDTLVSLGWITSNETPGLSYGTVLAFGALIGMPFIFAVIGLAIGLIVAVVYNIFAKITGGIELNIWQ